MFTLAGQLLPPGLIVFGKFNTSLNVCFVYLPLILGHSAILVDDFSW